MKHSRLLFLLFCLILGSIQTYAQTNQSSIIKVNKEMKDTFSFSKEWAYLWWVVKDVNGEFHSSLPDFIPIDTSHQYFTANCVTNVQGQHKINYCHAGLENKVIILTFKDGKPAYSNSLIVQIKDDSFSFKPEIRYKTFVKGQNISYEVRIQNLTLNKNDYAVNDTIMGYIDIEFTEIDFVPDNEKYYHHKYYLNGFFKTPIQKGRKKED